MTIHKAPGRYNLQLLGWKAFEDLGTLLLQEVLGETCTPFRVGADGGRDAFFAGVPKSALLTQGLAGKFVAQFKHTSAAGAQFSSDVVAEERPKVTRLAAQGHLDHYLLITNMRVSGGAEEAFREAFSSIPSVTNALLLGEEWIESQLDKHPRLTRLVPRLFGIGDLTQILSDGVLAQTRAVLSDLTHSFRTFVATDSYRRALCTLEERGIVFLVGPPASGKSAIAANICMTELAQNPDARILRVETAAEFKQTWSGADSKSLYWVDDVFGETAMDESAVASWSAAFLKLEAAVTRGVRVILASRDYILDHAADRLKSDRVVFLNDAKVRVNVTALSGVEREAILYNHVKHGSLSRERKGKLKPHLAKLAKLSSFTPELARRLGDSRFHQDLRYDEPTLRAFFDKPTQFFEEVIRTLAPPDQAAIISLLLRNNSILHPVEADDLPGEVLGALGVSEAEVRRSFDALDESLVKKVRSGNRIVWQLHHPSMVDAMQVLLSKTPRLLDLYVRGATIHSLLRDVDLREPREHQVFVPEKLYPLLRDRFVAAMTVNPLASKASFATFLAERSSEAFLRLVMQEHPSLMEEMVLLECGYWEDIGAGSELAARLWEAGMLAEELRSDWRDRVREDALMGGAIGPLMDQRIRGALGDEYVGKIATDIIESDFSCVSRIEEGERENASSADEFECAVGTIDEHIALLEKFLGMYVEGDAYSGSLREIFQSIEHDFNDRAEQARRESRHHWSDDPSDRERGSRGLSLLFHSDRFSDVDS